MTENPWRPSSSADEQRASKLFHDATIDLAPDADRLVLGSLSRGRALRRRRRLQASLAGVAAVGILGLAVNGGSHLIGSDAGRDPDQFLDSPSAEASPSATPTAARSRETSTLPEGATTTMPIDARVVVAAREVPGVVAELVPTVNVGEVLEEPDGVADLRQKKVVHFVVDGTLTTFAIERADTLATCAELVDPADQPDGEAGGRCVEHEGVTLLLWGPETGDGVTAQGVMAFVHGYVVSATSYNATDGKGVAPILDAPPLSMDDLTTIVTSDRWFGA